MKTPISAETPVRIGVFSSVAAADVAVAGLLKAGFTTDQITVVSSERPVREHFKQFEHQDPAGENAPVAAAAGGAIGAILGSAVAVAGIVGTGGLALVAAGPIAMLAAGTGGVAGSLVGAMMTRGVEKELANFYDQEVCCGKILVAAEDHGPQQIERLAVASRVLAEAGAEPIPLRDG
jgi:hypothetical protein